MNYLWLLLWFALSLFVFGAFLWSTRILYQQKRAWRAYAQKYKLNYNKGFLFTSPAVYGDFQGHRINVYSEEQRTEDAKGSRFRTVVELMRKSDLNSSGAIASGHLVPLLDMFNIPHSFIADAPEWSPSYAGRTNDVEMMRAYVTPERFAVINRLLRLPKSGFLFIYNPDDLLLRYETSDPMHDPRRLDKLVKIMQEMSEVLSGGSGEKPVRVEAEIKDDTASAKEKERTPEDNTAEDTFSEDPESDGSTQAI